MATIYDIAKHVGVSAGTVSRALSRPDKVLPATRTRIEQAALALGYVPNTVARTLKTQRSGKLLVTVPDIANPFFAQILQGAEDAAQAVGYAVLLGDTQHLPEREERYAQMLRRNEADGLIVLGHRLPPTAREIVQQQGVAAPVVNGCEFDPALGMPRARSWSTCIGWGTNGSRSWVGRRTTRCINSGLRASEAPARRVAACAA